MMAPGLKGRPAVIADIVRHSPDSFMVGGVRYFLRLTDRRSISRICLNEMTLRQRIVAGAKLPDKFEPNDGDGERLERIGAYESAFDARRHQIARAETAEYQSEQ